MVSNQYKSETLKILSSGPNIAEELGELSSGLANFRSCLDVVIAEIYSQDWVVAIPLHSLLLSVCCEINYLSWCSRCRYIPVNLPVLSKVGCVSSVLV